MIVDCAVGISFNHTAPDGYFYTFEEYKSGVISIWLNNNRKFDYNLGKPTKTVWGFWKRKGARLGTTVLSGHSLIHKVTGLAHFVLCF